MLCGAVDGDQHHHLLRAAALHYPGRQPARLPGGHHRDGHRQPLLHLRLPVGRRRVWAARALHRGRHPDGHCPGRPLCPVYWLVHLVCCRWECVIEGGTQMALALGLSIPLSTRALVVKGMASTSRWLSVNHQEPSCATVAAVSCCTQTCHDVIRTIAQCGYPS